MNEKVTMKSPEGEVREVDVNGPELVPLMVKGWTQVQHSTAGRVATPVTEVK